MSGALLIVSADLPNGSVDHPSGLRKDYAVLARRLGATVLDRTWIGRSVPARLIAWAFGVPVAQAWLAFRRRHAYGVIVTDGEHIGIPLALVLKVARARIPHVTIGHHPSTPKKRPFFRWLRVHSHITRMALHSRLQYDLAISEMGIPPDRLALVPYQADTDFWRPGPVPEDGRLICGAGLEHRDYATLFRAVDGLDVQVVIGAASYWSRCRDTANGHDRPPNVDVRAFDYPSLRDLYAHSSLVVVPLEDVDNQSGVTTILEAMAMSKAVIVTHTRGQTDVVEDRRAVTRGSPPRPRPSSMLRIVAGQAGVDIEPNGLYVPPGDADALRRAIVYLLEHPEERSRMGAAGRRAVERLMTVDQFADRLRELVEQARLDVPLASSPRRAPVTPGLGRSRSPCIRTR
jgi:glycosyltransferase involved in cell wall biosynthesis